MSRTAIIAGTGALPLLLSRALTAQGRDHVIAGQQDFPVEGLTVTEPFRVERIVPFIDRLVKIGVTEVVFAGAVQRPKLDPLLFDFKTALLVPRMLPALQKGDDGLLRAVIGLFEENDLRVVGVSDIAPELVPTAGILGKHKPSRADTNDAARAAEIVAALGAIDVGQGAVVAHGLCLALESLPGTDAMLRFVAAIGPREGRDKGVMYKAPKPGQDRRIDLPTLGPATIAGASAAGLAGIAFEAGGTLLLDRPTMIAEADRLGLFLWAREK
jgi:UDP-2,3-diacylglucosamine hydrolase